VTMTKQAFLLEGTLAAFDGEEKVFFRTWQKTIPRRLV
jgi:hypothetical protein